MTAIRKSGILSNKWTFILAGIIVSGLCWYISYGLNGDYWYLMWIAPVPVLLISFNVTAMQTFFVSFIAYLIGRLSWFSYLVSVASLIPAIIFTVALPVIFGLIMIITRRFFLKTNAWYAVFAFPVFFTAFEWLLMKFSQDGTAASIAYTQSDCIPFIQIVSITGILGITFMVTFIPSVVAIGVLFRKVKAKLIPLTISSSVLIGSVFLFGVARIGKDIKSRKATAGLAVLDEYLHKMDDLNFSDELEHIRNYELEISKLAARGARLIVLPERAININNEIDSAAISILTGSARRNNATIVMGFTNFKSDTLRNSALTIDEQGNVSMYYNKAKLVNVLEDQFTRGRNIGLFTFEDLKAGTAICKDLDFPEFINQYGRKKVVFVCVPAWDFVVDDWLHSRMAIMRGVENGFSEVRTARKGRLTISDPYGRVTSEADCSNGKATALVGQISLFRIDTFYGRHGDWFGIVVITVAIAFFSLIIFKKAEPQKN